MVSVVLLAFCFGLIVYKAYKYMFLKPANFPPGIQSSTIKFKTKEDLCKGIRNDAFFFTFLYKKSVFKKCMSIIDKVETMHKKKFFLVVQPF